MTGQDVIGFSDNGEPVPVWRPPAPEPEVELLDSLEDLGCAVVNRRAALSAIERAFDAVGDRRAAEALAEIFARLGGGKRGVELRLALQGAIDGGVAEHARRLGVSRQTLHQNAATLRRRILKKY